MSLEEFEWQKKRSYKCWAKCGNSNIFFSLFCHGTKLALGDLCLSTSSKPNFLGKTCRWKKSARDDRWALSAVCSYCAIELKKEAACIFLSHFILVLLRKNTRAVAGRRPAEHIRQLYFSVCLYPHVTSRRWQTQNKAALCCPILGNLF